MKDLTILCITNNEYEGTDKFIRAMRKYADTLCADLVLGLDREKAQKADWRGLADKAIDLKANTLQEDVMNQAVHECQTTWILRLDDDETISKSLFQWLSRGGYRLAGASLYAFPRVYLYPDAAHFCINEGMYPDLQTRLGRKELMYGVNYIHAGNPNGTGMIVPYALEHHKLIVRTYEQRKAIADRYESIRAGAGTRPEYARYNMPELFYDEMKVRDYGDGNFSA